MVLQCLVLYTGGWRYIFGGEGRLWEWAIDNNLYHLTRYARKMGPSVRISGPFCGLLGGGIILGDFGNLCEDCFREGLGMKGKRVELRDRVLYGPWVGLI